METKSFRYKVWLFIFNVTVFLIAVYLFFRHNWYCEPGVYTWFAFCEYFVVFSNIGFHWTVRFDFAGISNIVSWSNYAGHKELQV